MRASLLGLVILLLGACAPFTPGTGAGPTTHPTPGTYGTSVYLTAAPVQPQRTCAEVPGPVCAEIVDMVRARHPEIAASPTALVGVLAPGGTSGDDVVYLVTFAPFDLRDWPFSPPTWTVTRTGGQAPWETSQWRTGALPQHFAAQLRAAGIDPLTP